MYKKGDVVRVWSLQSFFGGGFIDGRLGIVKQDQIGSSVLVSVKRVVDGVYKVDPSYEVYEKQLEFVSRPENKLVDKFDQLLMELAQ